MLNLVLKKLVVIDGLCLLFRSFFAIKTMSNKKNENISGIYGFAREILSIHSNLKPDFISVALDTGGKTWRHDLEPSYKSHRRKTPEELTHQFCWLKDVCDACDITVYQGDGYEADDWIASFVAKFKNEYQIYIVSYDKDLFQLIDTNVLVYYPFKGEIVDAQSVIDKFGVRPDQIKDLLTLTGDVCDGVCGIKGIGYKTGAKWLNEYGSLESIITNIDNLTPFSRAQLLKKYKDGLEFTHRLVSLRDNLEMDNITTNRPCKFFMKQTLTEIGIESLMYQFDQMF